MSGFDLNQLIFGIIASLSAAAIAFVIGKLSQLQSIPVPIWVFAVFLGLLVIFGYFEYQRRNPELITVYKKKFGVERVVLDGRQFVECEFDRSEIVFLGKKGFSMVRSKGPGVRLKFEENAALTLVVLDKLYDDPGTRIYVEEFIKRITKSK